MNMIMEKLLARKSIRAYENKTINESIKDSIREAILRAPTAGNLMLYSVIEIEDHELKETLSKSCDNQPFIAQAPWVLVFCLDYQRWFDVMEMGQVKQMCSSHAIPYRKPDSGDFMLAANDAIIAAQNAVVAAESFELGSCYIGDIMEKYEFHRNLLHLPKYVFPVTMLCIGYPTEQQKQRKKAERFDKEVIFYKNKYVELKSEKLLDSAKYRKHSDSFSSPAENIGQDLYMKKFGAAFSFELSRSVNKALEEWKS